MVEAGISHQKSSKPARSSAEQIQAKFDLSIALALSTWQALTLAIQEQWGGPNSTEKRDWFAGAISDLFENSMDSFDREYLEEFMLQIMNDEFDVNIEDGSGEPIAELILKLKKETSREDFSRVDEMFKVWEDKQKLGSKEKIKFIPAQDEDNDTDWDSGDDDEGDDDDDVMDIDETPKVPERKTVPEVDADGFTMVVGRRGR